MPTASLTNFTVPLTTNQSASTQGLLMPKLKFRFRVTFINFGITQPTTELTKQVMDFKRPTLTQQSMEIPIYNSRIYYAGKPEWQEVTCTLRDDASGQVTKRIGEQIQKQFDFYEQSSAASGIDYKFQTIFEVLDGGNGGGANAPLALETWELDGCFLSQTDYQNADYSSNDPMSIQLTIRYDNAIQTPLGTGIGSAVSRTLGTALTG